jgi:SNF family Na+-dependent transporter
MRRYLTMGLPIVLIIILIGRGGSLPNAWGGIRLYIGTWHTSKLSSGQIWTAALGQVFFSTGVGFGYFTAYASYQSKFANAVQDALIICCSNSAFEVFAAFAVFGVVGFLGMVSLQEYASEGLSAGAPTDTSEIPFKVQLEPRFEHILTMDSTSTAF